MSKITSNISISPQDLFSSASTAGTDLGAYATTGDGRGFRYCLAGSVTLVVGKLQAATNQDTALQNLSVSNAAAAATSVSITSSIIVTANQLAGGLMTVRSGGGQGYTYRIKGNQAASSTAGTLTLEDALIVALTSTPVIDLTLNAYSNVLINPATATATPIGVAIYPITNAQYGWIQTKGAIAVLQDQATTVGFQQAPSASVAGAVSPVPAAGSGSCAIGYAMITTTDAKYQPIFLIID